MSRETEKNISQILHDVRRHSDAASQSAFTGAAVETGLTSNSDSYTSSSATSMTGSASASQLQDFDDSLSASVWTGAEESYDRMEIEPNTSNQTGMTGSASLSSMDFVDGRGHGGGIGESRSRSSNSEKLFFLDEEGDGERRSAVEREVRQQREELDKLNQAMKAELEEKGENNARYKKMMVRESE
jgi:hypothetical protein